MAPEEAAAALAEAWALALVPESIMAEDAVWAAERATEEPGKEILREGGKPLSRDLKGKLLIPQRALPGRGLK